MYLQTDVEISNTPEFYFLRITNDLKSEIFQTLVVLEKLLVLASDTKVIKLDFESSINFP